MRRLSALDTVFLMLERRQAPFHVGALSLFRPPQGAPADFAAQLARRLNQSGGAEPPFDQRLGRHFGIDFWETDTNFDLAHHFVHLALPRPGRIRELLAMVSRIHSSHLDRAYPLWRIYLIEGLEDGRIATFSKIHHSMVDGVAGIRLMLKSMSRDPQTSIEMPPPWELQASRTRSVAGVPAVAGFDALRGLASQGLNSIPAVFHQLKTSVRDFREHNPDLVTSFQAPRSILNQNISGSRRFAAQSYSKPRIKALASACSATSNDVLLALCSTALRRYLLELDALPDEPLIAGVPVSIRRDNSDAGNEITGALVNLATHVADPLERFRLIKSSMDYNKQRFAQMSASQLFAYSAAMLAPGLLTLLPGFKHGIANVIISHVPGPRQAMYWQGCRLEGIYPASLLVNGFALNITLISCDDHIDAGLLACRRTVPHMQRLLDYLEDALVELETATGQPPLAEPGSESDAARPRSASTSTLDRPTTRRSNGSRARYSSREE